MIHLSPAPPVESFHWRKSCCSPGWFHISFSALKNCVLGHLRSAVSGCGTGVDAHSAADQRCFIEAHWAPINHKVTDTACEGSAGGQVWGQ